MYKISSCPINEYFQFQPLNTQQEKSDNNSNLSAGSGERDDEVNIVNMNHNGSIVVEHSGIYTR